MTSPQVPPRAPVRALPWVVAAAVVAALFLVALFSAEILGIRERVTERIAETTGAGVDVDGTIRWRLRWPPTLRLGDVRVAKGSGRERIELRVATGEAELEPADLYSGEIRIRRVVFRGADLIVGSGDDSARFRLGREATVELAGERPRVHSRMRIERLVVPAPGPDSATASGLPLDALDVFDADLSVEIAHLRVGRLPLDDAAAEIAIGGGRLRVRSLEAGIAGGRASLAGTIDASADPARADARIRLEAVDLERLLRDLDLPIVATGTGGLEARFRTTGESPRGLLESLDGSVTAAVAGGRIATERVERLAPHLLPRIAPWATGEETTELRCAVARLRVANGTARTESLLLDTDRVTIVGKGSIDLAEARVSLDLEPHPRDLDLLRVALPIRIHGPLRHPKVETDGEEIARKLGDTLIQSALLPPQLVARLLDLELGDDHACRRPG